MKRINALELEVLHLKNNRNQSTSSKDKNKIQDENPEIATSHLLMSLSNAQAGGKELPSITKNIRIPSIGAQVALQNLSGVSKFVPPAPGYHDSFQSLPALHPVSYDNTISTDQLFGRNNVKRRFGELGHSQNAPKAKKRRGNLPIQATTHLRAWLFSHRDKPYPSEEEKSELVDLTGLTLVQINNWFSNARRRILNKKDKSSSPPSSQNNSTSSPEKTKVKVEQ